MIEIIPAIDVIDGKCVRLSQGDFSRRKIYSNLPLEIAQRFEGAGLKRLHIVDLDGARLGAVTNLKVLETISTSTNLTIDYGGGIKTADDLRAVFDAGASIASIGSIAVKEPEKLMTWIQSFGAARFLIGADVRDGRLLIDGWQTKTEVRIVDLLSRYLAQGFRRIFVTDIAKDGLLRGPSIELYKHILAALPGLELIASGGVHRLEDILELEQIGCFGVIVGKAIYEEKIALEDLANLRP